jgi:amino acid transporter
VHESNRDAGLVRQVGPWTLAASIVGMVVGATIFVLPATLAATIGIYAPWAFLACAVAVGSIAICFAEGGSRIPTSGGIYGYVQGAFGPLTGYIAGTLLWVSDVLACGGIAAALADVIVSVVPLPAAGAVHAAAILAAIGGIAFVNIGGVGHGARLVNATTAVKLIPLAIFIIVGATAVHRSNFVQTTVPGIGGLGRAMILGVFAFMGMETSLCASGEVAHPSRAIPRALTIAVLFTAFLYIAIQIISQGILGASLAGSTVPLADAMARVNPAVRLLMVAGAALSMLGYIASDILGSPRLLFAFARDGLLPRALGRIHPRTHSPHVAILCYAALASALALTGTFAELAVLSALSTAALYVIGCLAVWRLKRRDVALAGEALNFRWLGLATIVGVGSMLIVIALGARSEIIGLTVLVAGSAAIYLLQARTRRNRRR